MSWYRRFGKYNAKKTVCGTGHTHDSKAEAVFCDCLRLRKIAGDIKSYEIQVPIDLIVNGVKICTHKVDFVVEDKVGKKIMECKGQKTPDWILKLKLFNAIFPETPYIIVENGVEYDSKEYKKGKNRRKVYDNKVQETTYN